MSGICGIFHRDGQAVNPDVLGSTTQSLAFRGPDGQQVWQQENVGLGHSLLAIAPEENNEQQPLTLDQQVYLVADIRLDGRDALRSQLQRLGCAIVPDASDALLLLWAYHAWGTNCLSRIQGDFTFILWDERQQHLFCGRDQLGVRPLYYAAIANTVIVSNTLRTVQTHPLVTGGLNGAAIADFLLFGWNYNPQTTTFVDIHRLPGGHSLTVTPRTLQTSRYWELPVPEPIRYRRSQDYIEQFQWHLDQAVRDRTRLPQAGVFLSGGLDSSAMAATALDVQPQLQLRGLTVTYDHLVTDRERAAATQVTQALNIPLDFLVADELPFCSGTHATPEPSLQLFPDLDQQQYHWAVAQGRIVLYGQGGDEGLRPSQVSQLWGKMPWLQLLRGLWQTRWQYHRWPHWGTGLRRKRRSPPSDSWQYYPHWLNPEFAQVYGLRDRWLEITQAAPTPCPHPLRPQAYRSLIQPLWQLNFEANDAGVHGYSVVVMFPYLDLRLVNYLLAVPPYPWFRDKILAREALRYREQRGDRHPIPTEIINRPKTPLGGHPWWAQIQNGVNPWQEMQWDDAIAAYVTPEDFAALGETVPKQFTTAWLALRPLFLNQWLQQNHP